MKRFLNPFLCALRLILECVFHEDVFLRFAFSELVVLTGEPKLWLTMAWNVDFEFISVFSLPS